MTVAVEQSRSEINSVSLTWRIQFNKCFILFSNIVNTRRECGLIYSSTNSTHCWRSLCFLLVIYVSVLRSFGSLCLILGAVNAISAVFVRVISRIDLRQWGHCAVLGHINLPRLAWVQFLQPAGKTNSNARLVIACPYHDAVTDTRTVSVERTNKIVTTWVRIITTYTNKLWSARAARTM